MSTSPRPPLASDGARVAAFIEGWCRTSKGAAAGQPIRLRPWQRQLLDDLFTLRPDGLRQYRTALIGVPRKQGKSTLGSAIALYLLVADGEMGAEVYSVAGDKSQARIVFNEAKAMVGADPDLASLVKVYRDAIEYPATNSVYRVVSADAKLRQGTNPSGVLFDEVHVQPDDELWNAMLLGMGVRAQPLLLGITTAGYDEDSLCYRLYAYGKKLESGEVDDPTFFFRWWEPRSPDFDWRDQRVWFEANPALGDYLSLAALEADARITPEHDFVRFHLNGWVKTAQAWLPHGAWDACAAPDLALRADLPLRVGIDMAYSNDSAAIVGAQVQGERTVCRLLGLWENPYSPTDTRHGHWKVQVFEVEERCRQLRQQFPVPAATVEGEARPGPEFAFDPAWFSRSAPVLEGDGLTMVELPQSDSRMIPAAQTLYGLVTEGRLAHDGDARLKRHVENAVADRRPRGWRISKASAKRKIDACIALAIAATRAQERPPEARRSRWEQEGEEVLTL